MSGVTSIRTCFVKPPVSTPGVGEISGVSGDKQDIPSLAHIYPTKQVETQNIPENRQGCIRVDFSAWVGVVHPSN
jgi:hypothetical protein